MSSSTPSITLSANRLAGASVGERPRLGAALALAGGLSAAVMGVAVSSARGVMPSSELLFARSVIAVAVLAIPAAPYLRSAFRRDAWSVWVVAVSGALGVACFFSNLQTLTVGTAKTLTSASLVLVAGLSAVVLRERPSRRVLVGVGLMVTALVTLRLDEASVPPVSALAIGLGGAACTALAYVALRDAAKRFPPSLLVFGVSAASGVVALVVPGPTWVMLEGGHLWMMIALVSAAGIGANYFLAWASRHLQAPTVTALAKSDLLWIVMLAGLFAGAWPRPAEWGSYGLALAALLVLQFGTGVSRGPLPTNEELR